MRIPSLNPNRPRNSVLLAGIAVAWLAAGSVSVACAQEQSLGDIARQFRQARQKNSAAPVAAAPNAEQAPPPPPPADTRDTGMSLGEKARLLREQHDVLKRMASMPLRAPLHFEAAVAEPAFLPIVAAQSEPRPAVTPVAAAAASPVSAPAIPEPAVAKAAQPRAAVPHNSFVSASAAQSPALPVVAVPQSPVASVSAVPATAPQSAQVETPAAQTSPVPQLQPRPEAPSDAAALPAALHVQTEFKIKYVAEDAVYLSSGRSAGVVEGMKLTVKRRPGMAADAPLADVAELVVASVADTSSVCEIKHASGEIRPGDSAYLSEADAENLAQTRAVGGTRQYPQVITFTEGDPLEAEAREEVPRPPLPEVNRARGRIGLDYSGISSRGSSASSSYQLGGVVRADITRIGGTYWNLSGYWRGRFQNNSFAGEPTLQDLINRTYHLSLTYDSPTSRWVAGFGRLYLPWASSLDTLDGGYVGRKFGHHTITGMFAGSTPDPTSWDYNPDRRTAGAFVAFEGGSFDSVRFTSTTGMGVSSLGWVLDRPYLFTENGIFFKRYLSIYESAQADNPRPAPGIAKAGPGLSRSYVTVRIQPHQRIAFDLNHTYFRDVPTFDQQLISTGLVDKYLFQGLSVGVRVEPIRHITLYTDLGRSDRTGDQKTANNELFGVSWDRIWKTGLRADVRASKFNGSFGSGTYRSISLSRNLGDRVHWQVQAGRQTLLSSFTDQGGSKFVNGSIDANLGRHYFFQADYTTQRGALLDYDQWILTLGYRFDNRTGKAGGAK